MTKTSSTSTPGTPPPGKNRLVFEKSPYLQQHASNPVDWYAWGEEAFEQARREDKPIFLSIGYSTCHWCHVMEDESFSNPDVALVLNELFVSIKIDREERPDVDDHYMSAVIAMTGSGGWPMSVFLTHDLRPFFGGTYFPPDDRYGRPGFTSLLRQLGGIWKNDREKITSASEELDRHLRQESPASSAGEDRPELTGEILDFAVRQFENRFDPIRGGFGSAPKFPPHLALEFLLRHDARNDDPSARRMLTATLDAMANGGIHDQVGGGFHRYSTDAVWLVPHFEKMLYDNALLARVYLWASQVTSRKDFETVGRRTLDYVLREMTSPEGGFYSAQDADDPGGEGSFYVWSATELESLLGKDDAEIAAARFGVTNAGNFEVGGHGAPAPGAKDKPRTSILSIVSTVPDLVRKFGRTSSEIETVLGRASERMFTARSRRAAPATDDKVLTDWNGLMISAMAVGYQVTRDPRYLAGGKKAADFLLSTMRKEAILLHRYRDGDAAIPGFLTDYAFLVQGLLDLYEASFEPKYLRAAVDLNREMLDRFWNETEGVLYLTAGAGEIGRRIKEDHDGAIPTGSSVAALNLFRLAELTSAESLRTIAFRVISSGSSIWSRQPTAQAQLLSAAEFQLAGPREIVLAGEPGSEALEGFHAALFGCYVPAKVVALAAPGQDLDEIVPMLEGRVSTGAPVMAYVCRNYTCQKPASEVGEMLRQIGGAQ